MKHKKYLYIIALITGIISVLLYLTNKNSTIKRDLKDFAFEDTATITKIFMVNKANKKVLLTRTPEGWIVNNKYKARSDAINLLLQTIYSVEIKSPIPTSSIPQVIKLLATRSTKVEIYTKKGKVKSYYVGDPTPTNLGTYMIMENSSTPYITHIPGFNGYLSVRYFVDEQEWRSTKIFNIPLSQLYSIHITNYFEKKEYDIHYNSANNINLKINNNAIKYFDTILIKQTIKKILLASVDSWINEVKHKIDSLKNTTPYSKISVKSVTGKTNTLVLYKMPNIKKLLNENGVPFEFDPDVLYGVINDSDLALCQYFIFDDIFIPLANMKIYK
ncbi:MAG: DUF4340 domain-containing protein [Bacteroidales bacterium]|nr:DUF4340 domain-containing protein [Bacteroidales bacterium]